MMKRSQDHGLVTSTSHRENTTTEKQKLKAKAVGCMSGLFHFVSSYNSRNNNKLLTFAKKTQEKKLEKSSCGTISSKTKRKTTANSSSKRSKGSDITTTSFSQSPSLISGDHQAPRSPALPPEIRRSPQNRSRSALVARLMGLEEAPAPAEEDSAAEKRRQLLGALEKCDRDLKALKRIIDAVRPADDDRVRIGADQQPSPVSVLDEFATTTARSPFGSRCSRRQSCGHGKKQQQFVRQLKKKQGEKEFFGPNIFDRISYEWLHKKPVISTDITHNNHVEAMKHNSQVLSLSSSTPSTLMTRNNKTMKETVEDVCRDIAWGQKREIGRIGLALQDHIFRDLVEEIVMDFGSFQVYGNVNSLPFESCKRRLCF